MEPINYHKGTVMPLDRSNIDTDAIIPKQFLKSIRRTGFGKHLFDSWRYLDEGFPGMNCENRPKNMDFIFNDPKYVTSSILLTRENFGCGSSREHAPWALIEYGFKVLIATSFADIFFSNCLKNGILPITLPKDEINKLFDKSFGEYPLNLSIDLEAQSISQNGGDFFIDFKIDKGQKKRLVEGLDEIGLTLNKKEIIENFEKNRLKLRPWLKIDPAESLE
ncbi:MAG: 3-isopropylmalate dehydratase small subunit [Betaproteobacteria bacterium TMED156]|nr:MAG: 3-isopropylmalate dehydratase small subunit [Betaproteobacteria bacterium TMED156]